MSSDPSFSLLPPPGSRILVSGGCGGIGRALVDRAVAAGLEVVICDLPAAIAAHHRPDVQMVPVDLSDAEQVGAAFALIDGPLDGFVSLAGFSNAPAPLAQMDEAAWSDTLDGNLKGVFLACKAALPLLRRSPSPSIVLVGSGQGVRPLAGFGPYGVAKAGLIALARSLALENAPDVRVNVVAPGAVRTAFLTGGTGRANRPGEDVNEKATRYAGAIPLGRIAEPEDIADPILFLLGAGARFMTGQVLHVNGGGLMP